MQYSKQLLILAAIFGTLVGCATTGAPPTERATIVIDSDPQGADIRIRGRLVGKTPFKASIEDHFPKRWSSKIPSDTEGFAFYRRVEEVEITKDGCEPYFKHFLAEDLATDAKITLRCDPAIKPAVAAPAPVVSPTPAPAPDLEQRLKALDELKLKGLITEDEFREQRQRILNSL